MTKLSNVKGRITYISSHAKQENLYAVYETTERKFWRELAKCNQEEFVKSGTEGKCIEARELIIALPESFTEYQPDRLLQLFTNHFKQNYGAECIAALHHNKRKTKNPASQQGKKEIPKQTVNGFIFKDVSTSFFGFLVAHREGGKKGKCEYSQCDQAN